MLKDLMSKEFNGELTEGEHNATLTSWQYVANKDNPDKDYIKFTFSVDNNGIQQTYNRNQFERDVSIMLSHLRRQLGRSNETIKPKDFFEGLIKNKTPFKIWIEYTTVATQKGMRRVQNLHFQPALAAAPTETSAEDSPLAD